VRLPVHLADAHYPIPRNRRFHQKGRTKARRVSTGYDGLIRGMGCYYRIVLDGKPAQRNTFLLIVGLPSAINVSKHRTPEQARCDRPRSLGISHLEKGEQEIATIDDRLAGVGIESDEQRRIVLS